ncbi:MAG: histidine--tRNA ligase [Inconstantimicrobium porci]|uniref:Histidine--tRNA ligase n=1 Tax=Inconstantimicrobium porci TaxID=2652291 RepID=A0A7X2SZS3_9CLOT|nr:histidine--tRNA ligase [Inconstantimicrobium porci]MDD6770212.1 histidine--tRNA ligase [Inconstantimicrobium porci]MDY5912512.1 histidine--tRNA ligase [Inconstantimicrobium porci]MSR89851.1 histidine--tRNA ligase [Inconstantimicrobium porci]
MGNKMQAPKGTKDMLPSDAYKWHYIEDKLRKLSDEFGVREIRTPMFESTDLFKRGVGETTDVVQKEMYTFEDKGGRSITLKPEGTAPAVRAFIQNSLYADAQPTKMYYFTDAFRYENVQKGRLRQFHQYGIEFFGSSEPSIDAEVITLAVRALKEFGLKDLSININSLGCPECRKKYNEALKEYFKSNYDDLCETCKSRFDRNPMRILDCKEKKCQEIGKGAPIILDYLCDDCNAHLEKVKQYLEIMGIQYKLDPYIVRGLDYYTRTVFEVLNNGLAICGGGRYDKLIEELNGPQMPAIGFGLGLERLLLVLESEGIEIPKPVYNDLYIGSIGENAHLNAFKYVNLLRERGLKCECDHMAKSVKAQMKYANKIDSRFTIILGDDELASCKAKMKRMSDGEQFEIDLNNLDEIANMVLNS